MVLNCSFYGAYVDAINWTRNGQPVEGKHIMVDPQVDKMWSAVVLDNVTGQQDVGKFECEAKRDQKVSFCFARPSKLSLLLICFLRFSYFSVWSYMCPSVRPSIQSSASICRYRLIDPPIHSSIRPSIQECLKLNSARTRNVLNWQKNPSLSSKQSTTYLQKFSRRSVERIIKKKHVFTPMSDDSFVVRSFIFMILTL